MFDFTHEKCLSLSKLKSNILRLKRRVKCTLTLNCCPKKENKPSIYHLLFLKEYKNLFFYFLTFLQSHLN